MKILYFSLNKLVIEFIALILKNKLLKNFNKNVKKLVKLENKND